MTGIKTIQWNNRLKIVSLMLLFLLGIMLFTILYLGPIAVVASLIDNTAGLSAIFTKKIFFKFAKIFLKITIFTIFMTAMFIRRDLNHIDQLITATPSPLGHEHPFYKKLEELCISRGLKVPDIYTFTISSFTQRYITAFVAQKTRQDSKLVITERALDLKDDELEGFLSIIVQRIHTEDTMLMTWLCFLGYFPYHLNRETWQYVRWILKPALIVTDWVIHPIRQHILRLSLERIDVGSLELTKQTAPIERIIGQLPRIEEIKEYYHDPYVTMFLVRDGKNKRKETIGKALRGRF